jgi:IS605 OrfB family transposase
MIKTITTILDIPEDEKSRLLGIMDVMADAQNYVVDQCYEYEDSNSFRMHKFVYRSLKEHFKLPAQLAVVANKYACTSVKAAVQRKGKRPKFSGRSLHYDKRSSTVDLKKQVASLLTASGRMKVKLRIPVYFRKFVDWEVKESNLVFCKDEGFHLMISVEKPFTPSSRMGKFIGVDRGINALVATSTGLLVEGKGVFEIKKHYVALRSRLQSKGTRSAKRHLKKMRRREKRFMRDVNHCLSKKLIEEAGEDGVIVFECLRGVRSARHRRKQNWLFSNWAFYQLEQFTAYKGEERRVAVEFVSARDTSKTCSVCGNFGHRNGSVFRCRACGVTFNADLNAAANILHRYTSANGLQFNQPIAPDESRLSKPLISISV